MAVIYLYTANTHIRNAVKLPQQTLFFKFFSPPPIKRNDTVLLRRFKKIGEIEAFIPKEYWSLDVKLRLLDKNGNFTARYFGETKKRELATEAQVQEIIQAQMEERMKDPVFIARAMYYGSDLVGYILVTGTQNEAVLEMIAVEPKWRGKGVASAMIEEAMMQLSSQHVPYLCARSMRRNKSAMQMMRRSGFEWVRTEDYLLGRDL